jgi:hypothetical protein
MIDDRCPKCGSETIFGFGLACGGTHDENGDTVPGEYTLCTECDWSDPMPDKTICFPHGIVDQDKRSS